MLELNRPARKRKRGSPQEITTMSQLLDAAVQLSKPDFHTNLPFPFVGTALPTRFKTKPGEDDKWFYMGREKFVELLHSFKDVRERRDRTALWVYGTKGYGKSHLLAALVCYFAAQEERIVYIPDCRECVKDPILYFKAAMLFAWLGDGSEQREIMTLDTMEKIYKFFLGKRDVIFIIDQMNALEILKNDDEKIKEEKGTLRGWLTRFRAKHKAILSSSANYHSYLIMQEKQSIEEKMHVYGGLTTVSLHEEFFFLFF